MQKNIDLDETTWVQLKLISAYTGLNVDTLIADAITYFVGQKPFSDSMTDEEKKDLGLLLLMQQVDKNDVVSEEEIVKALHE